MVNILGIFSESFWWVASLICTLCVVFTGLINQGFKIEKSSIKRWISWIVATVLSIVAWQANVIQFGEPKWLSIVSLCVVTGLSSNGLYSINAIREFISKWFTK